MKIQTLWEVAQPDAEHFLEFLEPHCAKKAICGSLRRNCSYVGDIEILVEPLTFDEDLLGMPLESHNLDALDWSPVGECVKGKHKQKKIILNYSVLEVDLFIVTPPAQWGLKKVLATGSAAFNKKLATSRQYGGFLPAHLTMKEGAFYDRHGALQPTPEEEDVFRLLGMKWINPRERDY